MKTFLIEIDDDDCRFLSTGRCDFKPGKLCKGDLNNRPSWCPLVAIVPASPGTWMRADGSFSNE